MKTPIIAVAVFTILAGVAIFTAQNKASFGAVKVTLVNPQQVKWDKPTTDAEWAEDVKQESFDIKSTAKLTEMRDVHTAKLSRLQSEKVIECPDCVQYELRKDFPDLTDQERLAIFSDMQTNAQWEVEKITQSIERMENELRLREQGFVIVGGEEVRFGATQTPYAIRTIND